jgi:hypothetical protein
VSEREREREREREKEAEARAVPAEMKKNVEVEGRFRLWLWTVIEQTGPWSYLEVLNSGAEVAGCSQQSIKRYLDKCCSRTGRFMLTGMKPDLLVELRPIPVEQSARPAKQDKATPGKEIMGLHAKILKAGA